MLNLPDWLFDYLMMLPKEDVIEIMANALDLMEAWNGRGITYCIVSSIEDATATETEEGGYTYQLPEIS
jgi:hypothetical protein